jgi:hypothetical protein
MKESEAVQPPASAEFAGAGFGRQAEFAALEEEHEEGRHPVRGGLTALPASRFRTGSHRKKQNLLDT